MFRFQILPMPALSVQQAFDVALQHHESGQLAQAEQIYRQILSVQPDHAEALHLLGVVAHSTKHHAQAMELIIHSLRVNPENPSALSNLGEVCLALGRVAEAIGHYLRALQLNPDFAIARFNLANAYRENGQFEEAIAEYWETLRRSPDVPEVYNNLGVALAAQGRLDEAIAAYCETLRLKPDEARVHGNLIFMQHFHPAHDERSIAEEQQRWNRQFAEPQKRHIRRHDNDPEPGRRLRIGYVSPDFRFHAIIFFVAPLLFAHDRAQFEIHCYASVARPDAMTENLRGVVEFWHDVRDLSDGDLAEKIRADGIDILVDLTMHMADNRLPAFARKPAPVQVTWVAYPGTTGLDAMDYRITDKYLDTPGTTTACYSEESIFLPDCWCCYHPLTDEVAVNALPALTQGHVTFGCVNNFWKVSDETLARFSSVLRAVEGSHLLLLVPEGSARERLVTRLSELGVSRKRVEFVRQAPRHPFLEFHHRIDIALDTLPYNGITTTCDALWMGVPVVTLVGKTITGRASSGLLSTVGLPELVATSDEEFIRIAKNLARDLPRLAELRASLRSRMEASRLMDAKRFTRNMESAYRNMWSRWCAGVQSGPDRVMATSMKESSRGVGI